MVTEGQIQLLSDLELLTALCSTQEDDLLYAEFVRRFLPELETECVTICRQRKIDLHVGKSIVHEVFEKVRKYKSFEADEVKAPSTHRGILIYLYRISRNLFNDWYNNEKKKKADYGGKSYFDDLLETLSIPDTPDILKWKRDVAVAIFKKLNNKEQQVVLADIDHKKHVKYLPDDITESLALSLNVKKDTIRKIRERAIEKIKKAIDEINQQ